MCRIILFVFLFVFVGFAQDNDANVLGLWQGALGVTLTADDSISAWADQSDSSNNFSASAGSYPYYVGDSTKVQLDTLTFMSISAANAGDFNPGTGDFSFECAFRTPASNATNPLIVSKRNVEGWQIYINSGTAKINAIFDYGGGNVIEESDALSANTTYYLAWTLDRDGYSRIYINGLIVDSTDISAHSAVDLNESTDFQIGVESVTPAQWFMGDIYEARYSNKVRIASEVSTYYASMLAKYSTRGADDYYISNNGDDGYSGLDVTQAWQTIAKPNGRTFQASDNIYHFTGDEWREQYTIPSSGTAGNPITLSAVDSATGLTGSSTVGAKPIINGANLIDTWVVVGGGKYYNLGISTEPRVIGINGVAATMVANSSLVDSQGEAFWTTSGGDTLFIFTSTASDTNNIEAATREDGFNDGDEDYITFANIEVRFVTGEAIDLGGNNNTVSNCTVYGAGKKGIVVWSGTDVTLNNNNLQGFTEFNGGAGIQTFTGPITVYSNTIKHFQLGIHVNNAGSAYGGNVYSNTIDSCDVGDIDEADGIKISGTDSNYVGLTIYSNTISGFRENGIDNNGTGNVIIEYNEIFSPLQASSNNVYGIKLSGANDLSSIARYNYIHDLTSDGTLGVGMYILGNFDSVYYNIIENVDTDGLNVLTADSVFVANNVVYGVGGWGIRGSDTATGLIFRNNIVDGVAGKEINLAAGSTAGGGTNIMATDAAVAGAGTYTGTGDFGATDPLFIDAANSDFNLRNFSPAVDRGIGVGLTTDYSSNAILDVTPTVSADSVDIGAYEIQSRSTSLYVSNTGSNDSTGVSTSNPIATIAHLQICYLVPGDNVYYDKGDLWREQYTVQCSGTSGNPIFHSAYGTGADPIIDGSGLVSTWTSAAVAYSAIWSAETQTGDATWANGTKANNLAQRVIIDSGSITAAADCVKVVLKAHSAANTVINDIAIGMKNAASDAFDYQASPTPVNIQFSGADNVTVTAGATSTSDVVVITIDADSSYLVAIQSPASWSSTQVTGSDPEHYTKITGVDESETVDVTGYASDGLIYSVHSILGNSSPPANVWQATLTTEPDQVFFDSVLGTNETDGTDSLNATREWYWSGNVLSIYYTEDPDGAVVINASIRDRCIQMTTKSYITIDNIEVRYSNLQGIGIFNNSDNVIVQNVTSRYNYGAGINYGTLCDNGLIDNCDISYNTSDGIALAGTNGNALTNMTISNNTIYEQILRSANGAGIWAFNLDNSTISNNTIYNNDEGGIRLDGGAGWGCDSTNIENNTAYSNANSIAGAGNIQVEFSNYCDVRYNYVHTTGIGGSLLIIANSSKYCDVYYNVIRNTNASANGGIKFQSSADSSNIYNNTLYDCHYAIYLDSLNSVNVKNNIISASLEYDLYLDGDIYDGSFASDYNLFTGEGTATIRIAGVVNHTLATHCADSTQDCNSISSDPLFTDAANDDFTLQELSPAIDAGTSVGLVEDKDGNTVPFGNAVDIGAYESQISLGGFNNLMRLINNLLMLKVVK